MELNENAQIDTGQVRDVGAPAAVAAASAGMPIPMGKGGGIGLLDRARRAW